ncbi:hypothetical protein ALC57_04692 [Trachymyrmex cornetzi]|uniref:Uncharacterized protein n=1 Tax=Trachymyrmex cornetzi TaxID=471704 RepID=A0A195EDI6_9HYME|nr:hypothetical protein ALC57_04692 [Trachymyrmex cornetzi]
MKGTEEERDANNDDRICESAERSRLLNPAGALETTRPRLVCLRSYMLLKLLEGEDYTYVTDTRLKGILIKREIRLSARTIRRFRKTKERPNKRYYFPLSDLPSRAISTHTYRASPDLSHLLYFFPHDRATIPIIFLATDLQIRVSTLPAIEILAMLRIIHAYIIAHKT